MIIEVDYNPSPKDMFFISVSINDKEAISFDYTSKGHRVIKQVLVDKKPFPKDKTISSEWDVLVLENLKFVRKYHAKWIDYDQHDLVNNEIWETKWSQPISNELKETLLHYSRMISDNYKNLKGFSKELAKFEVILSKEISKYA